MKTTLLSHGTARFLFSSTTRRFRRAFGLAALLTGVGLASSVQALTTNCVPAPEGLVGWWRGEGDGADAVNQNAGNLLGGYEFTAGIVGQAFLFDGSTGHLRIPDHPSLRPTAALTVEAWVKPTTTGTHDEIISKWDVVLGPNQKSYTFSLHPDRRAYLYVSPTGTDQLAASVFSTTAVPLNEWTHLVGTYDGNALNMYVNGVWENATPYDRGLFPGTNDLAIGGYVGAAGWGQVGSPFAGAIDEPAIYQRALNTNEIAALYAAGSAGKCPPTNPPPHLGANVPWITSFHPAVAPSGSLVNLVGTNFSAIASNNVVYFGATRAHVTAASETSLSVLVPVGATFAPPTVTVNGLMGAARQGFIPTFSGGGLLVATNFAPRFNLPTGDGPHQVVIADLDGDGKPDLAVTDNYAHTISVYRNISAVGTLDADSFAPRVVLPANPATYSPYLLVAGDVDGDGRLDLVATDVHGNTVSVFRNQATPGTLEVESFAPFVTFAVGAGPRALALADLDGDGRPEIVTANHEGNTISILRNQSSPGEINASSFAPQLEFPAGPGAFGVVVADLDGDAKLDIATANLAGNSITLFRNIGTGPLTAASFAAPVTFSGPAHLHYIRAADLDRDGRPELVVTSYLGQSLTVYRNQAMPGVLDASSFAPGITYGMSGRGHTSALGDVNGDGKLDVVVDTEIADSIAIFQNQHGDGAFTNDSFAARINLAAGWNAWGVAVGDLDGDGRPDIVFANAYHDTISIYHNRSSINTNPPPITCVHPPNGLVGWWRAEGDGRDAWGQNDGAVLGSGAFAPGMVGQAFQFEDGANQVRVSAAAALDVGQSAGFSVEAWVNPESSAIGRPIVEWVVSGGYGVHFFTWNGGAIYANVVDTSGGQHILQSAPGVLIANAFQHVALTYDKLSGQGRLFVNGAVVAEANLGNFTPRTDTDLLIGYRPATSPFGPVSFLGLIDEISLYGLALSTHEIAAIYAAGSAGKCPPPVPPLPEPLIITQQPQSIVTNAHANVRFSVVVTGSPTPGYQWFFNNAPLGGQVNAAVVLNNVTPSQAGDYFVIASNPSGSVTSSVATLTVLTYPPAITNQPKSIAAVIGNSASFSVGASGSAPLSYQWFFTGQPLPGRTQATLTLTNLQLSHAGDYFVRVSNPYGVTTSAVATLTVCAAAGLCAGAERHRRVVAGAE
jgi:hypothetical protein